MSKVVDEYNKKSVNDNHDLYELASWFLYHVVTIHPFQDENGRLCHLLASYSLMHDGLPFSVTIIIWAPKSTQTLRECYCKRS